MVWVICCDGGSVVWCDGGSVVWVVWCDGDSDDNVYCSNTTSTSITSTSITSTSITSTSLTSTSITSTSITSTTSSSTNTTTTILPALTQSNLHNRFRQFFSPCIARKHARNLRVNITGHAHAETTTPSLIATPPCTDARIQKMKECCTTQALP
ncbi:hypothetical protein Pmani_018346 [Petrolisthes manimaculis]|uniref:Uncharacterized protein n=1 Tax=Petrolisthes manimaculis TaxID=1843537 RepID=A0AAE1PMM8_9EUCA|nr:hypothetical protein Pmani_018346 [Petrolisthes manimaculis]